MITRRTVSRTLVTLGCIGLIAAAAAHYPAYQKISAPAVHASNLPSALQSVFEIAFLSMGWNWLVLALIALVATFGEARTGKAITLICGFAVLIQAAFIVPNRGALRRGRTDRWRVFAHHYRRAFVFWGRP